MIRKILLLTFLFSLLYIFFKFLNIYLDLSIISKIIIDSCVFLILWILTNIILYIDHFEKKLKKII